MKLFLVNLTLASLLFGCSPSKEETAESREQQNQLNRAVNQPLEQAKNVEKQILDSAEQQNKQVDGL